MLGAHKGLSNGLAPLGRACSSKPGLSQSLRRQLEITQLAFLLASQTPHLPFTSALFSLGN